MALIGLVQLTQGILKQALQDTSHEQQSHGNNRAGGTNSTANNTDTFVPSTQRAAPDAGTFQVQQVSLFSAAATVLLQQTPAANEAENAGNSAANSGAGNAAATNTAATNGSAVGTGTAEAPTPANAAVASDSTGLQSQLASLNAALTVLGLSQSDITVIDRVAQLIKDFNPNAFVDLINQLQALAQAASAPAAAVSTANANAAAANANTAAVAPTAATPGAALPVVNSPAPANFSLQALSIRFSGVNETVQETGQGQNAHPNTINFSAFGLQISEVSLTLNDATTGQTAQIQAPQAQVAQTAQTQTVPSPVKTAAAAA